MWKGLLGIMMAGRQRLYGARCPTLSSRSTRGGARKYVADVKQRRARRGVNDRVVVA